MSNMPYNVVSLFDGWIPVMDQSNVDIDEATRKVVDLPKSGMEVAVCRGKYLGVPVELAAIKGSPTRAVYMRAYGVTPKNREVNEAKLREAVKLQQN